MKSVTLPLVSVITPGYNGKNFISRCLESVLAQTYKNIEYIYVDDGSTDGTANIVKSYSSKFEKQGIAFKFISQQNKGCSEAVMEALKHIKGKYYVSLEYDDCFTPESIERRVNLFETLPSSVGLLVCNAAKIDEETNQYKGPLIPDSKHLNASKQFENFLNNRGVNTSGCLMFRMEAFDATHPQRKFEPSRYGYLWQTTLPVLFSYDMHYIEEELLLYYIRKESISHATKSLSQVLSMIEEFQHYVGKTLESIPMDSKELHRYKSQLHLHFTTRCMLVCLKRKEFIKALGYFTKTLLKHNPLMILLKCSELIKG